MTNDEKYTKVAQALQTLRNECSERITPKFSVGHVVQAVRSCDALNAMLSHVSVDDMVKLFDLIAGDAINKATNEGYKLGKSNDR
jgi:hypothetical protein